MMSAAEQKYKDDFWSFSRKQQNKAELEEMGASLYLSNKEYEKQKYISETGIMEPTVGQLHKANWFGKNVQINFLPDPIPSIVWKTRK